MIRLENCLRKVTKSFLSRQRDGKVAMERFREFELKMSRGRFPQQFWAIKWVIDCISQRIYSPRAPLMPNDSKEMKSASKMNYFGWQY